MKLFIYKKKFSKKDYINELKESRSWFFEGNWKKGIAWLKEKKIDVNVYAAKNGHITEIKKIPTNSWRENWDKKLKNKQKQEKKYNENK